MNAWELSVGTWTDEWIRVRGGWTNRNLFQRGRSLRLEAAYSPHNVEGLARTSWPALLLRKSRTDLTLSYDVAREDNYTQTTAEAEIAALFEPWYKTTFRLGLALSVDDVDEGRVSPPFFGTDPGLTPLLRARIYRDAADNPIEPRGGYRAALSAEWSPPLRLLGESVPVAARLRLLVPQPRPTGRCWPRGSTWAWPSRWARRPNCCRATASSPAARARCAATSGGGSARSTRRTSRSAARPWSWPARKCARSWARSARCPWASRSSSIPARSGRRRQGRAAGRRRRRPGAGRLGAHADRAHPPGRGAPSRRSHARRSADRVPLRHRVRILTEASTDRGHPRTTADRSDDLAGAAPCASPLVSLGGAVGVVLLVAVVILLPPLRTAALREGLRLADDALPGTLSVDDARLAAPRTAWRLTGVLWSRPAGHAAVAGRRRAGAVVACRCCGASTTCAPCASTGCAPTCRPSRRGSRRRRARRPRRPRKPFTPRRPAAPRRGGAARRRRARAGDAGPRAGRAATAPGRGPARRRRPAHAGAERPRPRAGATRDRRRPCAWRPAWTTAWWCAWRRSISTTPPLLPDPDALVLAGRLAATLGRPAVALGRRPLAAAVVAGPAGHRCPRRPGSRRAELHGREPGDGARPARAGAAAGVAGGPGAGRGADSLAAQIAAAPDASAGRARRRRP